MHYEHVYLIHETFQDADTTSEDTTSEDTLSEDTLSEDTTSKTKATKDTKALLSKRTTHTISGLLKSMHKMSNLDSAISLVHKMDNVRASLSPIFLSLDPKTTDDNEVVTVLWTGGVASTFRICELLFVYKRTVRPLYMEQTDMDDRESYAQERVIVKALHKYMLDTRKKDIKHTLLSIEMYESPIRDTPNTTEIRKRLSFIFNMPPTSIDNFYIYLIKLRAQQDKPHTELSTKSIELVLPEDGPHDILRNAVEQWGTRFVRLTRKNPPNPNTPQMKMLECTFIVSEPPGKDAELTNDQQRQKQFAQFFNHIHFILPCQDVFYIPYIIDTYKLKDIMQRTWSCRKPVSTTHQIIIQQNKIKHHNLLHASLPIGSCNSCVSCRLRQKDGLERIPPNLFNNRTTNTH